MATQTEYSSISALIIDDMATQQSTLRSQLLLLGMKADVCGNAEEAIRMVKARAYGLILCDFNLNNKTDGQQLLEHLRDNSILSPDCLFFMITAENSYVSVASATEHHPDAYLLKPSTAGQIEERLKAQLDKRAALIPITKRLAKDDLAGAIAECDKLLGGQSRWVMQALQIKGQSLLKLDRHDEAKRVYREALEKRPQLIWAQLGLARAHKAAGQFEEAKRIAREIIESKAGEKNVAAYDVLAEALEAQGDPQGAMGVLREAASVVPSARRHRVVGESAYRNGDLETAKESLQKVAKATRGSVVAQPQDTLLLAQTLVDCGEADEACKVLQDGQALYRNTTEFGSVALAIQAQAEVKAGREADAQKTLARARESLRQGKADFATIALAKAELVAGDPQAGLKLLESAVSADHENPRIKQMVGKALRETGHEDQIKVVVDSSAAALEECVKSARKLMRDGQIDEAVKTIEEALLSYPENTGVLLQAAQINCVALRLKKEYNEAIIERVRIYLTRLDKLMPGSDRLNQMKRYLRETLAALEAPASV